MEKAPLRAKIGGTTSAIKRKKLLMPPRLLLLPRVGERWEERKGKESGSRSERRRVNNKRKFRRGHKEKDTQQWRIKRLRLRGKEGGCTRGIFKSVNNHGWKLVTTLHFVCCFVGYVRGHSVKKLPSCELLSLWCAVYRAAKRCDHVCADFFCVCVRNLTIASRQGER